MEPQKWLFENHLTFRDFVVILGYLTYKTNLPTVVLLLPALYWVNLTACSYLVCSSKNETDILVFTSLVWGMTVFVVLPIACLSYCFWIFKTYQKAHSILEISSIGIVSKTEKFSYERRIQWSQVKGIKMLFGIFFLESTLKPGCCAFVPFHNFENQAEGERFCTDFNYFWEQGR